MLKLLTELQKLKGRWITFTELQELENCKTKLQDAEKLKQHYLFKYKEEYRENGYLRSEKEVLVKKYTVLSVIFWLTLILSSVLWFIFPR